MNYLNDSGFETKGCLGANAAFDEMYNNRYDLVISDIMMPEMDGNALHVPVCRDCQSVHETQDT